MRDIGFVVWGVRSGFKNNWLTSNVDSSVLNALTDEMRIYCHGTVTEFLSIEKVNNFNVVTIYNPNTTDHVGRRAYMAISIVVPKGYGLTGNVIGCIEELMATYSSKQGNAMVNKVSSSDFDPILAKITATVNSKTKFDGAEKLGIFKTTDFNSCNIHFQDLTICEYKKVYFLKEPIAALEKKEGIELVRAFRKPNLISINGYNPQLHEITINDRKVQGSKHVIFSGDAIKLTHLGQKVAKRKVAGDRDIVIHMSTEFPPKIAPPKPVKTQKSSRKKVVLTSVLSLSVIGGLIFSYFIFFGSNEGPGTSEPKNTPEATFYMESGTLAVSNAGNWKKFYILKDEKKKKGTIENDTCTFKDPDFKPDRSEDRLLVLSRLDSDKEKTKSIPIQYELPHIHKVKGGENLSKIGEKYGISVGELQRNNGIDDDDKIIEGQELTIIPETIKVEDGQTLENISKKYEISIEDLKQFNGLENETIEGRDSLKLMDTSHRDEVKDSDPQNAGEEEDNNKTKVEPDNDVNSEKSRAKEEDKDKEVNSPSAEESKIQKKNDNKNKEEKTPPSKESIIQKKTDNKGISKKPKDPAAKESEGNKKGYKELRQATQTALDDYKSHKDFDQKTYGYYQNRLNSLNRMNKPERLDELARIMDELRNEGIIK